MRVESIFDILRRDGSKTVRPMVGNKLIGELAIDLLDARFGETPKIDTKEPATSHAQAILGLLVRESEVQTPGEKLKGNIRGIGG